MQPLKREMNLALRATLKVSEKERKVKREIEREEILCFLSWSDSLLIAIASEVESQEAAERSAERLPFMNSIEQSRARLDMALGKFGKVTQRLCRKKERNRRQQFSMSLLSALSQDKVVATQLLEGGVDSTIFENFVYRTLNSIRSTPETQSKQVLVFMDNAVIHRHAQVLETCKLLKCHVLFNAQYSPWLNPVE